MVALEKTKPTPEAVLAKALINAGTGQLGLTQAELASVIGVHRTAISRIKQNQSLDPKSKQGELALLVVRLARALYALTGGDQDWMRHFMRAPNQLTGGVPAKQIQQIQGLVDVLRVVDGLRGKV